MEGGQAQGRERRPCGHSSSLAAAAAAAAAAAEEAT